MNNVVKLSDFSLVCHVFVSHAQATGGKRPNRVRDVKVEQIFKYKSICWITVYYCFLFKDLFYIDCYRAPVGKYSIKAAVKDGSCFRANIYIFQISAIYIYF